MSNATSTPTKNNWVMMDHIFIALRKAELLADNGAEGRGSDEIYLAIRQEVYREWPGGGPDAEFPRRAADLLAERDVIKDSEDARQDVSSGSSRTPGSARWSTATGRENPGGPASRPATTGWPGGWRRGSASRPS